MKLYLLTIMMIMMMIPKSSFAKSIETISIRVKLDAKASSVMSNFKVRAQYFNTGSNPFCQRYNFDVSGINSESDPKFVRYLPNEDNVFEIPLVISKYCKTKLGGITLFYDSNVKLVQEQADRDLRYQQYSPHTPMKKQQYVEMDFNPMVPVQKESNCSFDFWSNYGFKCSNLRLDESETSAEIQFKTL